LGEFYSFILPAGGQSARLSPASFGQIELRVTLPYPLRIA